MGDFVDTAKAGQRWSRLEEGERRFDRETDAKANKNKTRQTASSQPSHSLIRTRSEVNWKGGVVGRGGG